MSPEIHGGIFVTRRRQRVEIEQHLIRLLESVWNKERQQKPE